MRSGRRDGAFTLLEVVCSAAIVAFMVVGIAVTTDLVIRAESDARDARGSVSGARPVLAALEEDLLFARDAFAVSPEQLAIDVGDGLRTYWVLDAGSLVRRQGSTSSVLIRDVARLEFAEIRVPWSARRDEWSLREVTAELVSFASFPLRPGYTMDSRDAGTLVTERVETRTISGTRRVGWLFTARVSPGTEARINSIEFRGRRNGTDSLDIAIYAADPATRRPIRGSLVSRTQVATTQLPTTQSGVIANFAESQPVVDGKLYIVELRALRGGNAADVECVTLSIADAADSSLTEFVTSNDGGATYRAIASPSKGGQAPISVLASFRPASVDADGESIDPGSVTITTAIDITIELASRGGDNLLRASFAIPNQLSRVRR